jgi:hypothetical protein
MQVIFSVALLMIGLIILQYQHYAFVERQKSLDKVIHGSGEIDKLRKEFDDYKKRVDALTLKAGFKL